MKEIKHLPNLDWTELAARQIEAAGGDALINISAVAYRLGNAAVIGLVYPTFCTPPWLWFALSKNVTMRDLIDFRRMQEAIPKGALTTVEDDDPLALRFACFYGFAETGKSIEHEDKLHLLMRKV